MKILAPTQEVPVGLLRIECEVKAPVTRVEFYLEDKKILVKNRPPYTVELDLGKIPKKQTLKALGFDVQGNFVDADAWAINEKDARLAVRILELPKQKAAGDDGRAEGRASSPSRAARRRSSSSGSTTRMVKEWTAAALHRRRCPSRRSRRRRSCARRRRTRRERSSRTSSSCKGESRFMSKVEVNLVELPRLRLRRRGAFREGRSPRRTSPSSRTA